MPPRKSNVSTISASAGDSGTPGSPAGPATPAAEGKGKEKEVPSGKKKKDEDELAIEDLTMPRTMVQRLAKGVLPPNTQVQRDAITALSKGATVFINYLSSAAQTHASASNRKTINPNDVFAALNDTEFESLKPRLEAELAKYNEIQTGKRNEYRKKVRESTGARKSEGGEGEAGPNDQLERETAASDNRAAKRAKGSTGEVLEGGDDEDVDMNAEEEEEQEEPEAEEEEEEPEESEGEGDDDETMDEDPAAEKPVHAPGDTSDHDDSD